MALLLWFALVYGSKFIYRTYTVPVQYVKLPPGMMVKEIEPREVEITFFAPRRAFYFLGRKDIQIYLKPLNFRPGLHSALISLSNLQFPKTISLENIDPRRVKVRMERKMDSNFAAGKSVNEKKLMLYSIGFPNAIMKFCFI